MGAKISTFSTFSTWKDRKSRPATATQLAEWEKQYQHHFEQFNRQYFANALPPYRITLHDPLIVPGVPAAMSKYIAGYCDKKRHRILLEVDIRIVPESSDYPEGVRYRCYLGNPRTQEIIVLYDIHPGKPHHRHIRGKEELYHFTSPEQLWNTFVRDVEAVLRGEL